jgi:hypothetical protein
MAGVLYGTAAPHSIGWVVEFYVICKNGLRPATQAMVSQQLGLLRHGTIHNVVGSKQAIAWMQQHIPH